jgi:hypothetical protein
MAKPAKKPATYVAQGITALGRSKTYKRRGEASPGLLRRAGSAGGADAGQPPCNARAGCSHGGQCGSQIGAAGLVQRIVQQDPGCWGADGGGWAT